MGLKRTKYLDIWTAQKMGLGSTQQLDRSAIDRYTAERLKATIEYAVANSDFYGQLLGEALEKMKSAAGGQRAFMEAFKELPFTDAEDLRTQQTRLLCVGADKISRIVTLDTGGSTGSPKRIYFTEEDQQLTVDYFQNGMQLIVDSSDKVLILMPAKAPGSIGRLLGQGLRNLGNKVIEYGLPIGEPRHMQQLLELISAEKVTSVVALPTHMRMLAEELVKGQGRHDDINIRSVLLSAEYIAGQDVELIERVFDCKVYEHYGMTEMGLGCAVSCGHGDGYHIRELDLYIEIVDPQTGQVIDGEEPGEIVFTTLTRKGMPFIRYRTGDYSRWIHERCRCGSVLRRIAKVGPRDETKGYLK